MPEIVLSFDQIVCLVVCIVESLALVVAVLAFVYDIYMRNHDPDITKIEITNWPQSLAIPSEEISK